MTRVIYINYVIQLTRDNYRHFQNGMKEIEKREAPEALTAKEEVRLTETS